MASITHCNDGVFIQTERIVGLNLDGALREQGFEHSHD